MSKTLKNILIFGGIFVALVLVYIFFFKKSETPALVSSATGGAPSAPSAQNDVGQEFLSLLLSIKSIKLDGSIFERKSFQSLQDFSVPIIQPGNEGRINPFAPPSSEETVQASGISSS